MTTSIDAPLGFHAVFFDIRDTLGVVDRQGHLITYKPSTAQLLDTIQKFSGLRIGLITNLPAQVSSADGFKMVEEAGVAPYIDAKGFITNHDAGADKPAVEIYRFAARKMGLDPRECLFIGENLLEVVGAQLAGMQALLKPNPPGREFLSKPTAKGPVTPVSSGRLSEQILEEDHLIGKRIVGAGIKLVEKIRALPDPVSQIGSLRRAMGLLVWLTRHFIDPFHHRKEEEVFFPLGLMRGMDPVEIDATVLEHDQGRAYFRGMEAAYQRILRKPDDTAIREFVALVTGFTDLYRAHAVYENDVLFKQLGDLLSDDDDAIAVDLIARLSPVDITLYLNLISSLEQELA